MSESRTRRFIMNSGAAMAYQIIAMIAGFITPKAMLNTYGSEINGLISSILQFITYFNLVEAGLSAATVYSLYKPLANKDYKGINRVLIAARNFYYKSGWIFLALTISLAFLYPVFVKTDELSNELVGLLVIFLGATGVLDFFVMAKYRTLLTADQKNYVISIASTVSLVITTIIVIVCSHFNVNVVIMRGIAISPILIKALILAIYVRKKYEYINFEGTPDNSAMSKRWDALFLECLGAVHKGAPVVLATIFTSLKLVSVYSIFNMVVGAISSIFSIFTTGLPAAFGEIIAKGESEVLQKSIQKFEFMYYNMITCVYTVAVIMIMPFITLYTAGVEDVDYNIPILGFLFVLDGLLYNAKSPQGMLIISAGKYKETKYRTLIQAIIIVVFGLVLAPILGLEGIVIASICANLYRTIEIVFYVNRNITHLPKLPTYKKQLIMIFVFTIGTIVKYSVNLNIDTVFSWVVVATGVTIAVLLVQMLLAFMFEKKELIDFLSLIKNQIFGFIKRGKA